MSARTILQRPDPRLAAVCALNGLDQFYGLLILDRSTGAKRATLEAEYAGVVA